MKWHLVYKLLGKCEDCGAGQEVLDVGGGQACVTSAQLRTSLRSLAA